MPCPKCGSAMDATRKPMVCGVCGTVLGVIHHAGRLPQPVFAK